MLVTQTCQESRECVGRRWSVSRRWPRLLLLLVALSQPAWAQTQCFSLKGTSMCKGLDAFYVRTVPDFANLTAFDAYVASQSDDNASYQSAFRSYFGCPNWDGRSQRYHRSTLCFYLVQKGGCAENPSVQPMCKSQCSLFTASTTAIFANATACSPPSPEQAQARSQNADPALSAFAGFCASLNDAPGCRPGLDPEFAQCGFSSVDQVKPYCSVNNNDKADPCCAKASAVAANAALDGVAQSLGPVNNTPWIAAGAALGTVFLLSLLFVLCVKVKPWAKASTKAMEPPPADLEPGTQLRFAQLEDGPFATAKKRRTSIFSTIRASIFRKRDPPAPFSMTSASTRPAFNKPSAAYATPSSAYSLPDDDYPKSFNKAPPTVTTDTRSMYSSTTWRPTGTPRPGLIQLRVAEAYAAQLGDELTLAVGDVVTIDEEFDDGWGIGRNESTGQIGAVPMSCLVPMDYQGERTRSVIRERTMSLYASGIRA